MSKSKNDAPIKFRDFAPNPAGGEWPEMPHAQGDRNVDIAHEAFQNVMKRTIVPLFLANNRGNVRQTAEMIATLFIGFLHNFLADNLEQGEKGAFLRISKAAGECMEYSHKQMQMVHMLSSMGLPQPIISAVLHSVMAEKSEPDVKVFTMKAGEELPEELLRFLRS